MPEPGLPLGPVLPSCSPASSGAHGKPPLSSCGPRGPPVACSATNLTPAPPCPAPLGFRRAEDGLTSLASATPRPLPEPPAPAGGANAALRCSQGGSWKFEPLLGEELDLRRVTWRLPPELIPRLSASSGRSSDGEPPRGPPEDSADGGAGGEGGGLARGATPRPPGGDGLARRAPTPHPARRARLPPASSLSPLWSGCPLMAPCPTWGGATARRRTPRAEGPPGQAFVISSKQDCPQEHATSEVRGAQGQALVPKETSPEVSRDTRAGIWALPPAGLTARAVGLPAGVSGAHTVHTGILQD